MNGRVACVVVALLGLCAGAARAQQVAHLEVAPKKTPLSGAIPDGVIDVGPDHVVVSAWYGQQTPGGPAACAMFVVDKASGATVAELPGGPEQLRVVGRTALILGTSVLQAGLHDLATGAKVVDLPGLVVCDGEAVYSDANAGKLVRHDPATGRPLWELAPGKPFGGKWGIKHILPVRDGAWIVDDKKTVFLKASREGKEVQRYEVPAAEVQTELGVDTLPVGPKDLLLLLFNGVQLGKERGPLLRLIGDGKPKDLPLPGGRPSFVALGGLRRHADVWTFERKGKLCGVAEARADGSELGDPDIRVAIDLRRWKVLPARFPRDTDGVVSVAGYIQVGADLWDAAEGKKVATAAAPARWLALSERQALEWNPDARAARLVPLAGGEARAVALPGEGVELVRAIAPRGPGPMLLLTSAGAKTALLALDPDTGEVTPVAEHEGPTSLVTAALRPVGGQLWALLAVGQGRAVKLHLYGVEVKAEPKGGKR